MKQQTIPTLKSDAYHKTYFKHDVPAPLAASDQRHFEIHHRCALPDVINAHRLDFYMLFMVVQGEGIHTFGTKEYYIRENMLCFVAPHMVQSWRAEKKDQKGYFVGFSETFFHEGFENKHFLQELPFFQLNGNAVLALTEAQTQYYLTQLRFMHEEFLHATTHSPQILRSQLQLLIHKAHAQALEQGHAFDTAHAAGIRLVKSFKELYLHDFRALGDGTGLALKKIAVYADTLGVSQNHLNDTVKSITGKSAGQLIREHLANHATMCLLHADKSISEIAYALGFEDPSYFARFYKSQTGKSPSEFRVSENL
ncbi:helix-turn-helix domain-containing protein [Chryseolinea lacunae]|uniref:AraC family transcriptional regulator n=1 Tax=Chryseolinea lacunae TaxID=2801331 RepID=A0ABS1KMI3_9BACT|nr:helix-turn-helix domain-containing protein [Chryseolinea lacunae]MBL0740428.1 AraC family transcriptional regulator [Chryseolinea lacunae]